MGGGDGRRGMSQLGTAFTVIFVITLVALLAQLLYILLRRRVFRRRAATDAVDEYGPSSKEQFLYFFCVRGAHHASNRSPVQTIGAAGDDYRTGSNLDAIGSMSIDVDVLKLQGMFGPPRFLFTIKEEDEDQERGEEDEDECGDGGGVRVMNRAMSLKQCFDADDDGDDDVAGDGGAGGGGGTSLFSTPCASPQFFTPSDSPVHVSLNGGSSHEEMGLPT